MLVGPEGTRLLLMSPSRLAVLDRALLDTGDFPPVLIGDLDGDGDDDLVREGASGVRLLLLEGPSAMPPALAFPPTPDGFRLVR